VSKTRPYAEVKAKIAAKRAAKQAAVAAPKPEPPKPVRKVDDLMTRSAPTIGRIVLFHRTTYAIPAIVTRAPADSSYVDLVWFDACVDPPVGGEGYVAQGTQPGQWSWPR
jgi:hypothetical protein